MSGINHDWDWYMPPPATKQTPVPEAMNSKPGNVTELDHRKRFEEEDASVDGELLSIAHFDSRYERVSRLSVETQSDTASLSTNSSWRHSIRDPTPRQSYKSITVSRSVRTSAFDRIDEELENKIVVGEFKSLHRVPCRRHASPPTTTSQKSDFETRSQAQHKNVPTCPDCLYSAIHNLSWSATYLSLHVFQAELKLTSLSDTTAVDVVGNSALHYAAAAGAHVACIISLIQAKVNPYHINTEGQLFLHCLQPNWTAGQNSVQLWSVNLITTLKFLQHLDLTGSVASFRWRDNEGRTFLDTIASRIQDDNTKDQVFQLVLNAGYSMQLSDHFLEMIVRDPLNASDDVSTTKKKLQNACTTFDHALSDPNYVDTTTRDNVFHALSRLKLLENNTLISRIEDFASKDVDLNHLNRERQSPLTAFILNRPWPGFENQETGATMSKYLDALLWKDRRRFIPNKINVNMRDGKGATALYYAAVRGRPDSVRSLLDAGANPNARVGVEGQSRSILEATVSALESDYTQDAVKLHEYDEVISYLGHEGAVMSPTLLQERRVCANTVRLMPL
ncbi:uncharacterized protein LY89DRAFT_374327 [Mollisia scopiformis]|uniref:Uncharacterized protein n=1 Tax=Mollisia scopiformis TaxID=149040 RepID=A0A132B3I7_MOLSC|nr:uncharacterized protein LY89DRAFT_374327 [Mollisia scopiformis]KUJ06965.1 hypothetical protein LY89DRAFT_374327 [Mollisia scopiformis]